MLTGVVIVIVDIETKIVPILDSIHIVFYLNEVDVVPKLMLTISHYFHEEMHQQHEEMWREHSKV
jgi:hypothetical protein